MMFISLNAIVLSVSLVPAVSVMPHGSLKAPLLSPPMYPLPLCLGEFLEEHRRVLDGRLQPIMREILDARARSREELESRVLISATPLVRTRDQHTFCLFPSSVSEDCVVCSVAIWSWLAN